MSQTRIARRRPELPTNTSHQEICRYIMQAAKPEYPALPFIASLYIQSVKFEGLTDKQRRALDPHCRLFLGYGCWDSNVCKGDGNES